MTNKTLPRSRLPRAQHEVANRSAPEDLVDEVPSPRSRGKIALDLHQVGICWALSSSQIRRVNSQPMDGTQARQILRDR